MGTTIHRERYLHSAIIGATAAAIITHPYGLFGEMTNFRRCVPLLAQARDPRAWWAAEKYKYSGEMRQIVDLVLTAYICEFGLRDYRQTNKTK